LYLVAACALPFARPASADSEPEMRQDKRIVAILFSVGQTRDAKEYFKGVANLDLLEVGGKPMIMHVYEALKQSRYIDKIVIVAAPEVEACLNLKEDPRTSFVVDRGDAAENVQFGAGQVEKGDLCRGMQLLPEQDLHHRRRRRHGDDRR